MVYLLSFPRSGNTFLRYCIEELTSRPTMGCMGSENDLPIYQRNNVNIHIQNEDSVARKEHFWPRVKDDITAEDSFVLLLRDFKECLVRHAKTIPGENIVAKEILDKHAEDYFELIRNYDEFGGKKSLIYYEEIIKDQGLRNCLMSLSETIFDFKSEDVNNFMKNVDSHRESSFNSYLRGSESGGDKEKYHQRELSNSGKSRMVKWFKNKNKELYKKYLKRYG